jgi:hypothetical protein
MWESIRGLIEPLLEKVKSLFVEKLFNTLLASLGDLQPPTPSVPFTPSEQGLG